MTPTVVKKAQPLTPPQVNPTAFEVGRAKIEIVRCFRLLEFYAGTVHDPDFQKSFRENLDSLVATVPVLAHEVSAA